ncbi:hypothetical protein ACFL59_08320 [Planctomycetota bacterium]
MGWLRAVDDPRVLRHLTERRLRPITRIGDEEVQRSEFARLVEQAMERVGNSSKKAPKVPTDLARQLALAGANSKEFQS